MLIDWGAKTEATNKRGQTPLHSACGPYEGQRDAIELLLNSGANIEARDNDGMTPLSVAVSKGLGQTADLLVERGADPKVVLGDFDTFVTRIIAAWLDNSSRRLWESPDTPRSSVLVTGSLRLLR